MKINSGLSLLAIVSFVINTLSFAGDIPRYDGPAADEFMTEWMVAGPFELFPDTTEEKTPGLINERFRREFINVPESGMPVLPDAASQQWQHYESDEDIVDFTKIFGNKEFVSAYAYAEIESEKERPVIFGAGSDDGIIIWLNGKKIHDNNAARAVRTDDDFFKVTLKKGINSLLIKVYNQQYGWGFTIRKPGQETLGLSLIKLAGYGELDGVKLLAENGANINAANEAGLTPYTASLIARRSDMTDYLLSLGAEKREVPAPEKLADHFLQYYSGDDKPGATVLVARDGKILYSKGFGMADADSGEENIPETIFRIGSITKQFTATAILKLREEKKLDITDKLSKYLPDFPRADEVTINHLLTHTSGIHSYTNVGNLDALILTETSDKKVIDTIKTFDYDFDPGTQLLYNNSGYYILGMIVEQVSGKPIAEYLKEKIFLPLEMRSTGWHKSDDLIEGEAKGYSFTNNEFSRALDWNMDWAGGAGQLYSTTGDMFKWNEALFSGNVLNEESMEMAFRPAKLNNGEDALLGPEKYGYGWVIGNTRGLKIIHHGGGLHGFSTFLARFPEQKLTVCVLTNCLPAPPNQYPQLAAYQLAEYYLWEEMEPQESNSEAKDIDKENYSEYVGKYEFPGGAILDVTLDGEQLYIQLSGQPKFEVFPKMKDEFFLKVVEAKIKFFRDDSGNIEYLVNYQGGRETKAPRLADDIWKEAEVAAAVLDKYVGKYDMGDGMMITITKKGENLYIQLSGQPQFQLYPRSETEFFLKVVKATVYFKENSLTLEQGGQKFDAQKK